MAWIAVALGGALGCVARHGVSHVVHARWPFAQWPVATLMVNVLGCLMIGVLAGLIAAGRITMTAYWREFVFVGILGGFTTFSTFGLDTITLLRTAPTASAIGNVAAQVGLGLSAVYVGLLLGAWR